MKKYLSVLFLTLLYSHPNQAQVFINQSGYVNNLTKFFYTDLAADSFYIIDIDDGIIYYADELLLSVSNDPSTGLTLYRGDFTSLQRDGDYFVKTSSNDSSFIFKISSDVFENSYRKSLKGFYYQRCGTSLLQNNAGVYFHPPCHTNDGYFHSSTSQSGYLAVSGGWHDAGDYGKYIVNAGITLGTLLMAYENFPPKFTQDDLNIPESGNNISDLLDEVRYELDWFLKMQNLNGGIYFKLTKQQFESFIMPNNDSGLRYIYQVSSTATGDFVAVMAKAARIFQPFDSVFADQCLNAALLGWTFLTTNPSIVPPGGFVNPAGTVTGQYGDNNDSDERLWAAAELFETTGEVGYHDYFISNYNQGGLINSTQYWGNVKNFALLTYLNSQKSTSSETLKNSIRNSLINYCNTLRSRVTSNGFGVVINPGEYSWGSNSDILNKALLLINAYEETSNNNYYEAAIFQLNYILGCNAHNLSFVTGIGAKSVRNPHHRPSASDGVEGPVPGLLAGGPDQYLDDPLLQSLFNSSTPPALCYVDNVNSYASNEIAINWNAPLVFVLGYFNGEGISGIDKNTPKDFRLEQNFPNPFNPITIIRYNILNEALVKIKIYDTLGSEVAVLVNEKKDAGQHEIVFNANAFKLSSGVYFYKIETGNYSTTKKMIYLR